MASPEIKSKVSALPKRRTRNSERLLFAIMGAGLVFKAAVVGIGLLRQTNAAVLPLNSTAPTATVKNGTLVGEHNSFYNQDFFKGIPYAQPPVNDLRFRVPVPLNSSWSGTKTVTEFSPECVGYGSDQTGYTTSEDCLTLNVIRPSNASGLPVAVWIHGGGLYEGGNADRRYNMSFIIQNSVDSNNPIIGVQINYRLSGWGWLYSKEIQDTGVTNIGLRDQRLALHWVQENIEAFGGDPTKVTIFGESAGGLSVGAHLYAYGGRDDGLFRGAMSQSGTVQQYARYANFANTQEQYDGIVNQTGCSNSTDSLQCLREVPFTTLNNILNATSTTLITVPAIDGDIIQGYSSLSLREGSFLKIPYLTGTNTDEASGFAAGAYSINTSSEFQDFVENISHANTTYLSLITTLYPDIPSIGLPPTFLSGNQRPTDSLSFLGAQYKRVVSYYSDYFMHSSRRATSQAWSKFNVPNWSYRFNIIPAGFADYYGIAHFQEVAWVFNNLEGVGYATNPFEGASERYIEASTLMTRMWSSFVTHLDPNFHGVEGAANWPAYSNTFPKNFVFDGNVTSYVEEDVWRAEGIQFMIDSAKEVYSR